MAEILPTNENNDDLLFLKELVKDTSLSQKLTAENDSRLLNEQGMMESRFMSITSKQENINENELFTNVSQKSKIHRDRPRSGIPRPISNKPASIDYKELPTQAVGLANFYSVKPKIAKLNTHKSRRENKIDKILTPQSTDSEAKEGAQLHKDTSDSLLMNFGESEQESKSKSTDANSFHFIEEVPAAELIVPTVTKAQDALNFYSSNQIQMSNPLFRMPNMIRTADLQKKIINEYIKENSIDEIDIKETEEEKRRKVQIQNIQKLNENTMFDRKQSDGLHSNRDLEEVSNERYQKNQEADGNFVLLKLVFL